MRHEECILESSEERKALERIGEALLEEIARLSAGRRHFPPANVHGLTTNCFEVLLSRIAVAFENLESVPTIPASSRHFLATCRTAIADYQRDSVQASTYLNSLAEGWRCPQCQSIVAAAAIARDFRTGKIDLQCKSCGTESPLAPAGETAFHQWFGHLPSETWNPAGNGFLWRR